MQTQYRIPGHDTMRFLSFIVAMQTYLSGKRKRPPSPRPCGLPYHFASLEDFPIADSFHTAGSTAHQHNLASRSPANHAASYHGTGTMRKDYHVKHSMSSSKHSQTSAGISAAKIAKLNEEKLRSSVTRTQGFTLSSLKLTHESATISPAHGVAHPKRLLTHK
jgi:hypothetical protein